MRQPDAPESASDALKAWLWERLEAADFRYLEAIARAEGLPLDAAALGGASAHPDARRLCGKLGASRNEREADFLRYGRRFAKAGLRVLWREDAGGVDGALGAGQAVLAEALDGARFGTASAPPGIWWRGPLEALERPRLGVSGSRMASESARDAAGELARRAAREGWAVVHGGALGTDAACARACWGAEGFQVVVPGGGLGDALARHPLRRLFADRCLMVGIFAPFAPPTRWGLLRRNWLVALLSGALAVAETGPKGGTWSAFGAARSLGRPAFALEFERRLEGWSGWPVLDPLEAAEGYWRLLAAGASPLPASWIREASSEEWARTLSKGPEKKEAPEKAPEKPKGGQRDLFRADPP